MAYKANHMDEQFEYEIVGSQASIEQEKRLL